MGSARLHKNSNSVKADVFIARCQKQPATQLIRSDTNENASRGRVSKVQLRGDGVGPAGLRERAASLFADFLGIGHQEAVAETVRSAAEKDSQGQVAHGMRSAGLLEAAGAWADAAMKTASDRAADFLTTYR